MECRYSPICDVNADAYAAYATGVSFVALARLRKVEERAVVDFVQANGSSVVERARQYNSVNGGFGVAGFICDVVRSFESAVGSGAVKLSDGVDSYDKPGAVGSGFNSECRVEAHGDVQDAREQLGSVDAECDSTVSGLLTGAGVVDTVVSVSAKTLANREKRAKKKERKLRKQRSWTSSQSNGAKEFECEKESRGSETIPQWRRGAGPNTQGYRGAFETCDQETRNKLAETRAKRLIAENEAAIRKAQLESDRWADTVKLQRKQENLRMLKVGRQIETLRSDGVESIQENLEQQRLSQQLKIVQTRQKLELASAQDVESLKRRQASKVLRDTETNKVAVERAYGALAGSDNLPSLVGGKVFTVKSGSISPNSSASEAEVRAIQKKNLDLEKQVEELTAELGKLRTGTGERQDYDGYDYSEGVTIDEDGHPIGDFGDYSGYIGRDNRFHFGESMMPYFD